MRIVTLTTDNGSSDFYAGLIRGRFKSVLPDVELVEITHNIPRHDIMRAALTVKNCYSEFPPGTIHIVSVLSNLSRDPAENTEISHVAIKAGEHFFIGTDNGIFSLIIENLPIEAVDISHFAKDSHSFPTLNVFIPAAKLIYEGKELKSLGPPLTSLQRKIIAHPIVESDYLIGTAIYPDAYGNIITNITRDLFEESRRGRAFRIIVRRGAYSIHRINRHYSETAEGDMGALFNFGGNLELFINQGNISELIGIQAGDMIRVEFN